MDRYAFEEKVFKSNLTQAAKLILLAYSHHSDAALKAVYPSHVLVAQWASCSRETVSNYTEALAAQGWLVPGQVRKNNVQTYEFGTAPVEPTGLLAKRKRNLPASALDNLKNVKVNKVVGSDDVVVGSAQGRLSVAGLQAAGGVDTNKRNYEEQELEEPCAVADAPAQGTESPDSALTSSLLPTQGPSSTLPGNGVAPTPLLKQMLDEARKEKLEVEETLAAAPDPRTARLLFDHPTFLGRVGERNRRKGADRARRVASFSGQSEVVERVLNEPQTNPGHEDLREESEAARTASGAAYDPSEVRLAVQRHCVKNRWPAAVASGITRRAEALNDGTFAGSLEDLVHAADGDSW